MRDHFFVEGVFVGLIECHVCFDKCTQPIDGLCILRFFPRGIYRPWIQHGIEGNGLQVILQRYPADLADVSAKGLNTVEDVFFHGHAV